MRRSVSVMMRGLMALPAKLQVSGPDVLGEVAFLEAVDREDVTWMRADRICYQLWSSESGGWEPCTREAVKAGEYIRCARGWRMGGPVVLTPKGSEALRASKSAGLNDLG